MRTRLTSLGWGWISALGVLASLASTSAIAQDEADSLSDLGITMSLSALGTYTDNYFHQADDPQEAYGGMIKPNLSLLRESGALRFRSHVNAEIARSDLEGDRDDYEDYQIGAGLRWNALLRHRFDLSATHDVSHDPFGTARQFGSPIEEREIDRWRQERGELQYRFGAPGAILNSELSVNGTSRRYTTNEEVTGFLDHDDVGLRYGLFYQLSPKTSAVFQAARKEVEFEREAENAFRRDAEEALFQAGAQWKATAKTAGEVLVGYRLRDFDAGGSYDRFAWTAAVNWSPVGRTTLKFETSRATQESYRRDTRVIDNRSVAAGVLYTWTSRFQSNYRIAYIRSDFVGLGRKDDYVRTDVTGEYLLRRNVVLIGMAGYDERDTTLDTDPSREFDRIFASLGVRVSP